MKVQFEAIQVFHTEQISERTQSMPKLCMRLPVAGELLWQIYPQSGCYIRGTEETQKAILQMGVGRAGRKQPLQSQSELCKGCRSHV